MGIKITNLTKKYDSFGTEIVALGGVNQHFFNFAVVFIAAVDHGGN